MKWYPLAQCQLGDWKTERRRLNTLCFEHLSLGMCPADSIIYNHLELENLLLAVTQLLQDTSQLTLVLGADLVTADGLVQAGRTADEELDVLLLRLRQNSLQKFLANVALTTGPLLRRVVQDVEGTEALGVGILQVLKLLLQQDIILVDVAEDKGDLGLVLGVLADVTGELVHGGDTSTTGDKSDVVVLVGLPGVLDNGALERKALVNIQRVNVLGHGAIGVGLDNKLEEAGLV